ncbi:MAG: adenylate kinase [Oceanicoccus sp.]|jgi:adenylate kinase
MNYVLFGMQGSGKGTQSKFLADKFGLAIFETGAALRALASDGSELGNKIKGIMEAGNLVSTDVVMEIIADFIHKLPEGQDVLFDGIPRSGDQQEQFDALMQKESLDFKGILIEISEEEALRRLTTRRICSSCKSVFPVFYKGDKCENCDGELTTRKDDTPDAIRVRLDTFLEKTVPVIEDYKSRDKMIIVNGEQSIEAVTTELLSKLN